LEAIRVNRNASISCVVLGILFSLLSLAAYSDGIIIPDEPDWGWLSIVYHHVSVTARDGVVMTAVDQCFRNETERSMEGRYIFPLPKGAVVTDFAMWVDGEKLEGQILAAGEARSIYEDYVRRALDPALLEYVDRDTLAARIFPIPPGEERRIKIEYAEVLDAEDGRYRYHYPLDTERFSATPLESVKVTLSLEASAPLKAIYSPTHPVTVEREDGHHATVTYEGKDLLPAEDFRLYYSVSPDEMGMTLFTYRAPEEDGFFLAVLSPQVGAFPSTVIPKDLVLVLDRSGSMYGEKIAQAKDALAFILRNLRPEDRFAIVAFSDAAEAQTSGLISVDAERVAQSILWVNAVEANGGTNIDQALRIAFSLFDSQESGRARFLIFLTDGEPTVGEVEPLPILQRANQANTAETRLFVFGVGYDVNTFLLDRLAQENHGTSVYVGPGENLEAILSSFYRKIAAPALTSPQLRIDGIAVHDVYPVMLPDLFYGSQLLVVGRHQGSGDAHIVLSGEAEGTIFKYSYERTFPEVALTDSFLPRLWAGRKIVYLLDQIRLYGESEELVDTVVRLSTRYGIITPYTSFLIEEDRSYTAEEMRDAVKVAASAPSTGKQAVQGAASLRTLAERETVQDAGEAVRYVADRTFFLRGGIWVESTYSDEETIDIVLFSAAYFDLLALIPSIGPYLSLGDELILKVGAVYLCIGETGVEALTDGIIGQIQG
jgi:Ca-activated chloride channel family protein